MPYWIDDVSLAQSIKQSGTYVRAFEQLLPRDWLKYFIGTFYLFFSVHCNSFHSDHSPSPPPSHCECKYKHHAILNVSSQLILSHRDIPWCNVLKCNSCTTSLNFPLKLLLTLSVISPTSSSTFLIFFYYFFVRLLIFFILFQRFDRCRGFAGKKRGVHPLLSATTSWCWRQHESPEALQEYHR